MKESLAAPHLCDEDDDDAECVTLNFLLPNSSTCKIRLPNNSTYGELRAKLAQSLWVSQDHLGLFRRAGQSSWDSVTLMHDDVLTGQLRDEEVLKVIFFPTHGPATSSSGTQHQQMAHGLAAVSPKGGSFIFSPDTEATTVSSGWFGQKNGGGYGGWFGPHNGVGGGWFRPHNDMSSGCPGPHNGRFFPNANDAPWGAAYAHPASLFSSGVCYNQFDEGMGVANAYPPLNHRFTIAAAKKDEKSEMERALQLSREDYVRSCGSASACGTTEHLIGHHDKMGKNKYLPFDSYPKNNFETGMGMFGKVISEGSMSQYDIPGGISACTSVCLMVSHYFLDLNEHEAQEVESSFSSGVIDELLLRGANKHRLISLEHTGIEDLWASSPFQDVTASLDRGHPYTGMSNRESYVGALEEAIKQSTEAAVASSAGRNGRVVLLVTKPPETIACLHVTGKQWFLFDSHGQQNLQAKKRAYLMRFESLTLLASALEFKFPSLPGDRHDWQTALYNSFEAVPLLIKRAIPSGKGIVDSQDPSAKVNSKSPGKNCPLQHRENWSQGDIYATGEHSFLSAKRVERCTQIDRKESSIRPPPKEKPVSLREELIKEPPRRIDVPKLFLDPVMDLLMADPVVCDDGHTFERSVIEQHFETRRKSEEDRQRQAEQRAEDSTVSEEERNVVCCGARRTIHLTGPLSGEVVSDKLLPNRSVEQQIVDFVEEHGPSALSEEDLADWRERREEKRKKDREREHEERKRKEEEEQMAKNRVEAEERRRQEAESGISSGSNPSDLVRVSRLSDTKIAGHMCVAVALCQETDFMPLEYGSRARPDKLNRCSNACCSRLILCASDDDAANCSRCGRVCCLRCLCFQVDDIHNMPMSEHNSSSRICGECATQITEVMPTTGRLGQIRAYMFRLRVQRYMEDLVDTAVKVQDSIVKSSLQREFLPEIERLQNDTTTLSRERREIETQIEESKQRAARARADTGTAPSGASIALSLAAEPNNEINVLQELVDDLSRQYEALEAKSRQLTNGNEDEQFAHIQAISEVNQRLEDAQMQLMQARSATAAQEDKVVAEMSSDFSGLTLEELEVRCSELTSRYDQLLTSESNIENVTEKSVVSLQLEMVQLRIAQLSTTSVGGDNTTSVSKLQEEYDAKLAEYNRRLALPLPQDSEQQLQEIMRRSEISAQIENLQLRIVEKQEQNGDNWNPQEIFNQISVLLDELEKCASEEVPKKKSYSHSLAKIFFGKPRSTPNTAVLESLKSTIAQLQAHCSTMMAQSIIETLKTMVTDKLINISSSGHWKSLCNQLVGNIEYLLVLQQYEHNDGSRTAIPHIRRSLQTSSEQNYKMPTAGENSITHTKLQLLDKDKDENTDIGLIQAIGWRDDEWPLPLGLTYPTKRMTNQLELLRNTLQQASIASQRNYDNIYRQEQQKLQTEKDQLEDDIVKLRRQADNATASEEEENKRLEERRAQARRREEERQERERRRLEEERRVREEEVRLKKQHEADEEATRRALAAAVGQEDNAIMFGGRGDLRMCLVCKAGPVENKACTDLEAHNDDKANHCRNCGWFNKDWHKWLPWDGISGPH